MSRKPEVTYDLSKDEFFDHLIQQIEDMRKDDDIRNVWLIGMSHTKDGVSVRHYTNGPDELRSIQLLNNITVQLMVNVMSSIDEDETKH